MEHEHYMRLALELAQEAAAAGEVPVGCVIVQNGTVVGCGRNRREEKRSTASHAEMEAIAMANERLGSWRLEDCALYVTLEPCPMCAGAILNARIPRVFYGARDEVMGACGGVLNLYMERFANTPALVGGILAEDCRRVLEDFFRGLRNKENGVSDEEKSCVPSAAAKLDAGSEIELSYLDRRMLEELDTPTDGEQIKADVQRMKELAAQQKNYTQLLEEEFKEFKELESTIKVMREDGMTDMEIYNALSIF